MISLLAIVLASNVWLVDSAAFLRSAPAVQSNYVDTRDVKQILSSQLSSSALEKLSKIEEHLRPLYDSLPKTAQGKLEPAKVRYAIHRYFVQEHGWYMNGLEATGVVANSSASILKERAPLYIQSQFEEHLHGQGFGLHELAIFASILSDLVRNEAVAGVHDVFTAMDLPTVAPLDYQAWRRAVKAYIVRYLVSASNVARLSEGEMEEEAADNFLSGKFPEWPSIYMYVQDLHVADDLALQSRRNPFIQGHYTFDEAARFVQEFAHNFGSFQNLECKAIKNALLDMEYHGTGRVPLARFYASGLDGKGGFKEDINYLRHLGALDEMDPRRPSVVIPNYVTGSSNCVTSSGFYSVCCVDECGALLGRLEREIAGPLAPPTRIVELVSGMSSETVDAPRSLSKALVSRLSDITVHHGGLIPLHGRLFAQWMHHAYPRECPFPHHGVAAKPMLPENWSVEHGPVKASRVEMQLHVDSYEEDDSVSGEVALESLPWSDVEELLSDGIETEKIPTGSTNVPVRLLVACALLVSFAVPLVHSASLDRSKFSGQKIAKCMV